MCVEKFEPLAFITNYTWGKAHVDMDVDISKVCFVSLLFWHILAQPNCKQ